MISNKNHFDFIIAGAGIVGQTVAYEIKSRMPQSKIAIFEKEADIGVHASGRNSGVLHSGIYYPSKTLKAEICVKGNRKMVEFANENNIDLKKCGKIILATKEEELISLNSLLENAKNNNIPAQKLDNREVKEKEPYAADSYGAIFSPSTSVIDSLGVINKLRDILLSKNVRFFFNSPLRIKSIETNKFSNLESYSCGYFDNCAGAYADLIAKELNLLDEYTLVPFKGLYWKLTKEAARKVSGNIYPVPDLSVPFLGIHLTRVINEDVYIGPNSVPALSRENYNLFQNLNFNESFEISKRLISMYVTNNQNFRQLSRREIGNYLKFNFLKAAQKLVPSLKIHDLIYSNKVGIRPQLVNKKTSILEMDYLLKKTDNSIHVLNAISPAFTCSFEFAKIIVDEIGI